MRITYAIIRPSKQVRTFELIAIAPRGLGLPYVHHAARKIRQAIIVPQSLLRHFGLSPKGVTTPPPLPWWRDIQLARYMPHLYQQEAADWLEFSIMGTNDRPLFRDHWGIDMATGERTSIMRYIVKHRVEANRVADSSVVKIGE